MAQQANVGESQQRSAVRVDVERLPLGLWVCRLSRCDLTRATLLNVSGAGALIESSEFYSPSLRLHVRFTTSDKQMHSASAEVVRCVPSRISKDMYNVAVRLQFDLEGKRDLLIKWIFEEIVIQRRRLANTQDKRAGR